MNHQQAHRRPLPPWLFLLALSGCQQEQQTEQLRRWLVQAREESMQLAAASAQLASLPPAQDFQAYAYLLDDTRTPFGQHHADPLQQPAAGQQQRPPQRGAAQPLENFALDTIDMVGILTRDDARRAVVKVADQLYQVSPGDYLGQQFGMIEQISENAVLLQELVRDAKGAWIAHNTRLTMEEKTR